MAREAMITRTVKAKKVTALCLDAVKCEPFNTTMILSGSFKDEKALKKATAKQVETDIISLAKIVEVQDIESVYGMTEQEFIKHAIVLDPKTRKPIVQAF